MKATIGIIGGGQLGKMIAQEAKRMALDVVVLDPTPDCPAAMVCGKQIVADFKDASAIRRLAQESDVVTYEIELGNTDILKSLEREGFRICPAPETLRVIQDKLLQKRFLNKAGVPVPAFREVTSVDRLLGEATEFGFPSVLKCRTDSYDGRGNYTLRSKKDLEKLFAEHAFNGSSVGKTYMLEEFVPFKMEVSVMVARNKRGQTVSYPVVENIHEDHILRTTIAPARIGKAVEKKARKVAMQAIDALKGTGIFGVEMFVCKDGKVLINEIAPRPHNSGHYTIEACAHSQFELHIRAILNWPLVDPGFLSPAVMLNILGTQDIDQAYRVEGLEKLLSISGAKLHLYGKKGSRRKRKLGHLTLLDKTLAGALKKAEQARKLIRIVPEVAVEK